MKTPIPAAWIVGLALTAAAAQSQVATTLLNAGSNPAALAVDPVANKVYVINGAAVGELTVIDGVTKATSTIGIAPVPSAVVVNPTTGTAYVSSLSQGTVTVVDGATGQTTALTVSTGPGAGGLSLIALAVNPVTNLIYAADINDSNGNEGSVTLINGYTDGLTDIAPGINPGSAGISQGVMAVNPVTDEIYVDNAVGGGIAVIDGITSQATQVANGSNPAWLGVNTSTNTVYATSETGPSVTVVDRSTGVVSSVAVPTLPGALAVDSVSNKVYVVGSPGSGTVTVIDGATNQTAQIAAGPALGAIALDPSADKAYVVNSTSPGTVTMIDGATNQTTPITVGSFPFAIAVNTSTHEVYVLDNDLAGNVTVINATGAGAPTVTQAPRSQTVAAGSSAVFSVATSATPAPAYQWFLNGAALADTGGITGSTSPTLYLAAGSAEAGSYTCRVTNSAGSATGGPATLTLVSGQPAGRLVNLSSRASVGTGADIMITGFVVSGPSPKDLLLRGIGPSLASFDVTGPLAAPSISLFTSAAPTPVLLGTEDAWASSPTTSAADTPPISLAAATAALFSDVGAFALAGGSADSALSAVLPAGGYTAEVSGATGGTGVALAEVYDADTGTPASALVNLSSRAHVGTGSDVLIAGFTIAGTTARTVLIRASGPALGAYGVSGFLADPDLQVFDGNGNLVTSNEGWGGGAATTAVAASVGAFAWSSPTSADSAVLVTLPPGRYTAEVSGASGDTGVSLVEVYAVP